MDHLKSPEIRLLYYTAARAVGEEAERLFTRVATGLLDTHVDLHQSADTLFSKTMAPSDIEDNLLLNSLNAARPRVHMSAAIARDRMLLTATGDAGAVSVRRYVLARCCSLDQGLKERFQAIRDLLVLNNGAHPHLHLYISAFPTAAEAPDRGWQQGYYYGLWCTEMLSLWPLFKSDRLSTRRVSHSTVEAVVLQSFRSLVVDAPSHSTGLLGITFVPDTNTVGFAKVNTFMNAIIAETEMTP